MNTYEEVWASEPENIRPGNLLREILRYEQNVLT